ncbi:hypothetical protein LT988_14495 [Thiocapsa bogorovii]|nr:hypothetical protein LT988_14495 [Thiocapsa bogorovii]
MLGRRPNPPELKHHVDAMMAGASERDVLDAFLRSDEFSVRQCRLKQNAEGKTEIASYFVHIPKTAGMSVKRWIARGAEATGGRLFPGAFMEDLFNFEDARSYSHFAGHFGGFLAPYLRRPIRSATLLRDPVQRVISHHAHGARDPNLPLHAIIKGRSLEHVINDSSARGYLENFQAKFLAALDFGRYLLPHEIHDISWPKNDHDLLHAAEQNLEAIDVIGVLEDVDTFLDRLAVAWKLPRIDDLGVENSGYNRPLRELAPEVADRLREMNAIDYILYDRARSLPGRALARKSS